MEINEEIEYQKEFINRTKKLNEGKKLTYNILTMGCQLNENDSEKLCGMIEEMGYTKIEESKQADLAVMNTCCVRENAEDRLFGKLGELKKSKEEKGTIIAIGGCSPSALSYLSNHFKYNSTCPLCSGLNLSSFNSITTNLFIFL